MWNNVEVKVEMPGVRCNISVEVQVPVGHAKVCLGVLVVDEGKTSIDLSDWE